MSEQVPEDTQETPQQRVSRFVWGPDDVDILSEEEANTIMGGGGDGSSSDSGGREPGSAGEGEAATRPRPDTPAGTGN